MEVNLKMFYQVFFVVFYVFCSNFGVQAVPVSENENTINKKIEPKYEKFLMPKELKSGDEINIAGTFSNTTEWIKFSLMTRYKNRYGPDTIICQYEADFNNDTTSLRHTLTKGKGKEDLYMPARDLLIDYKFNVTFRIENEDSIGFHISESSMGRSCELAQGAMENIHTILVEGASLNVDMIMFKFA